LSSSRGESNTRNPVVVTSHGVLAFSNSVPQLKTAITGTRDDLTVVTGESDRQNILGVSDKSLQASAIIKIPETKSSIPRTRKSTSTISRANNVRDEVVVSTKRLLGNTELGSFVLLDVPDNDRLQQGKIYV